MSRSDASGGDAVEIDGKEGETLSSPDDDRTADLIGLSQLSLEEKGWISPPDSIFFSSSGSDITSPDVTLPDSVHDSAESKDMLSQVSNSRNPTGHVHTTTLSSTDDDEISPFEVSESFPREADLSCAGSVKLPNEAADHPEAMAFPGDKSVAVPADSQNLSNENFHKFEGEDDLLSVNKVKNGTEHREAPDPNINASTRVGKGMYKVFFNYFFFIFNLLISS